MTSFELGHRAGYSDALHGRPPAPRGDVKAYVASYRQVSAWLKARGGK